MPTGDFDAPMVSNADSNWSPSIPRNNQIRASLGRTQLVPSKEFYDQMRWLDPCKRLIQAGILPIVAGGACRDLWRGLHPRDVDIYVWSKRKKKQIVSKLVESGYTIRTEGGRYNGPGDWSVTKLTGFTSVDVIKTDCRSLAQIIQRFDYTVNACATVAGTGALVHHPYFFPNLVSGELVHMHDDTPQHAWRVERMHALGFREVECTSGDILPQPTSI